jgi:hypothetical protein
MPNSQQDQARPQVDESLSYVSPSTSRRVDDHWTANQDSPSAASFNMLSVLARVAHDQPVEQAASEERGPFDRTRFLDQFKQASLALDPDPYRGMGVFEDGLGELYKPIEPSVYHAEDESVYARIDQPRLDTAPEYDAINIGLLTETEAKELVEVYWDRVEIVTGELDPEIHTLDFLRGQSAALTTVVMMVASQCLPVSEHANAMVARLEAHLETLLAEIDRFCLQSVEICQALSMFVAWLSGHKLNRAWPLVNKAIAIAIELRLDVSPPPAWAVAPSPHHSASPARLARNVERVWLHLNEWDTASGFIRGRPPTIRNNPLTEETPMLEWCSHPERMPADAVTAASLALMTLFLKLQLPPTRIRLESPTFSFDDCLTRVDTELAAWRGKWLPLMEPDNQLRCLFDMTGFRFIFFMTPYEYGLVHGWSPTTIRAVRDACLGGAVDLISRALPILAGTDPLLKVSNLFSYRYVQYLHSHADNRLYRVAYTAFCTLRIISTAPQAGNADLFLLSIIAALARHLIDVRVHPNLASITAVLGRRLMNAARRLAATRLQVQVGGEVRPVFMPLIHSDVHGVGDGYDDSLAPLPTFSDGIFAMLDPDEIRLWGELDHIGDPNMPFVNTLSSLLHVAP